MKKKISIVAGATLLGVLSFGWLGLLPLLALLLNFSPVPMTCGAAYPAILTKTVAQYVSENAAVKEQLWVQDILDTNGASYQDCPFGAELTGRVTAGKPASHSQLMKAVVEITDTSKVRGDTINIFSVAGIGGEGATQGDTRQGTEAQVVTGNMAVVIGNHFYSVGYKQSEVDKTMIGKDLMNQQWVNEGLRNLHSRKKNDTIIQRAIQATTTNAGAANLLFPEGIASRELLRANDTVDLALIQYAGQALPGFGALPMDTTQDSGGSVGELYMFLSADKALVDFENDPTNTQVLQYGWDRGQGNPIFNGGFVKVRGHGLYRWIHRDHANQLALGSPLIPRAKLNTALTGANTGSTITGGGRLAAAAADTTAQWFENFSNAPFKMYGNVNSIAAVTNVDRYVKIINQDGTGSAIYNFRVTNGNTITILARVSGTGSSGASYNHPIGAIVAECNSAGTTFARSLMFGAQSFVGGNGSINGSVADPLMGIVKRKSLDYDNDVGIGVEGCAGYSAVTRAGDGAYTGFVVIEHALTLPGATNPS